MTEHRFDAIVIGGGPAGCAAAISLARQRYRVILLEAERGAARKTCGEFLSATAVRWLEETNVLPRLLQRGAIPIPKWSLATPRRELVGELTPAGLALSRSILDPLLREVCSEEGAIVAEGSRVKSVVGGAFGYEVQVEQETSRCAMHARIVVGAAGRAARIGGIVAPAPGAAPRRARYIAMKAHARATSLSHRASRVALYALPGAYVGVVPSGSDSLNVCFLARADAFPRGSHGQTFLAAHARTHPAWEKQWRAMDFDGARWTAVSTMDFEKRRPIQEGVIQAGDAAGMVSPFWGEGMAMALESGSMAAESAGRVLSGMSEEKARAEYRSRWRKRFAIRLAGGELLQNMLLSSRAVEATAFWAGAFPAFADWIVRRGASSSNQKLAPILGDQR